MMTISESDQDAAWNELELDEELTGFPFMLERDFGYRFDKESEAHLEKHGFEVVKTSHGEIYVNKERGLVCKRTYLLTTERPLRSVPTYFAGHLGSRYFIVFQRLVDREPKRLARAYEELMQNTDVEDYRFHRLFGTDYKLSNMGLDERGELVTFDW